MAMSLGAIGVYAFLEKCCLEQLSTGLLPGLPASSGLLEAPSLLPTSVVTLTPALL